MLAAFGDVAREPYGSFRQVFEAVADGRAQAGVVPIENVINGTVRENYDLLIEHDLVIRGEVVVPVSLCLAALPGQTAHRHRARLFAHPGARPGGAVPALAAVATAHDVQHGGCGPGHRGARRARRRGRPVAAGRGIVRAGGPGRRDRRPAGQPDALPGPGPVGRAGTSAVRGADAGSRRTTLVVAVRNEPGTLLRGPARLRRPSAQHAQARVATEPRARLGVRLLGRPRRGRGRSGDGRGARRARVGDDDVPRPRVVPGGATRLSGGSTCPR